jgi:AP endonuclease-2
MARQEDFRGIKAPCMVTKVLIQVQGMFEILEADIVVMQETKIQRKDLQDDMVLVPGWDVYFSLPKHKKGMIQDQACSSQLTLYIGYSGVAIYTRNAACAPIRAEEGITGILCPPNSTISFCDLPIEQQIGGYPSAGQLCDSELDAATLDSEGRCVILEFPAFVLIGVYSPANRDETRDEFRLGFLNALDARVRNLVAAGKRVFLTGDLNIIRSELDTANAEEQLRKHGMTGEEYVSTPARRLLNQLLVDGKVFGEKDEGREKPVLWDLCRGFHPERRGMFTCWETKINARPGNFGSRIDYVLCSPDWKEWFCDSNIQEGLIGSDHCPVYAVMKDVVEIDGSSVHVRDIMNPPGMFKEGVRQREWNSKDLLPLSARLIPEFDRRRSIRDMFTKKSTLAKAETMGSTLENGETRDEEQVESQQHDVGQQNTSAPFGAATIITPDALSNASPVVGKNATPVPLNLTSAASLTGSPKANGKRPAETSTPRSLKRSKSGGSKATSTETKGQSTKGQSSLKGFFKPKAAPGGGIIPALSPKSDDKQASSTTIASPAVSAMTSMFFPGASTSASTNPMDSPEKVHRPEEEPEQESPSKPFRVEDEKSVIDPIVAKESWSKLLSKRVVPRCEHNEPCVSFLTKKPGVNCGRSFYMCPRPLGPSGQKEKNTQWRCGTFIWSSDWTGDST